MPIITPTELDTHLYPEVMAALTRDDNTILSRAITAAEQEVKLYLGKFDLTALFGTESEAPAVDDALLKQLVKDVACWHLLRLSNNGTEISVFRTAYQDALSTLKNIMTGQAMPAGWPYAGPATTELTDGNAVNWGSNERRNNHY
ncbi:MAG: DUF1320 family protein [Chitinophagaceae bacterium]|nr:DUF1320 family protein [Chitinophagaceae bacterium]